MARKYVNPARSAPVGDQLLTEARTKAESAAARLQEAERADPLAPGWSAEFEAASASARSAARRVEVLEAARAAQLERTGQREATVKALAKNLAGMAAKLSASRDQVAAAAAEHLRALAALESAAAEHNGRLAEARGRVAELGLRVTDLDSDGTEHDEGVLDGQGLRAGGVDWTPIPGAGVVAHALRQVYGTETQLHPLAAVGKFTWRAHQVEARADDLRVPSLADAGAVASEAPARALARSTPLADVLPPREAPSGDVSGFVRAPRHERKTL